jgi:hypothetical protein
MTRSLAALAALALLAAGCGARPSPPAAKSELYLITSLPLLFGEGFGLGFAKPDIVRVLERDHKLVPADVPSQIPDGATLLLAQPRALPAEELVALDAWVQRGGRLVLLADPMLEWPSERPLGDRLRPPLAFADTGLLAHWGLRLDAPDTRGPREVGAAMLISPGTLVRTGGRCGLEGGWIARCNLGRGQATIIADADLLNVEAVLRAGGRPADNVRLVERLVAPAADD